MRILLFLTMLFISSLIYSQDKIHTKDGQVINAEIKEQGEHEIKYKKTGFLDGPDFVLSLKKVKQIEYRNGSTEIFGSNNPRINRPFGFSIGSGLLWGDDYPYPMFKIDYFLTHVFDLQLNVGYEYYSIGSLFHINSIHSKTRFTPVTGLLLGSESDLTMLQIPAGISFISHKGFSAMLNVSAIIYKQLYRNIFEPEPVYSIECSFGYKFGL